MSFPHRCRFSVTLLCWVAFLLPAVAYADRTTEEAMRLSRSGAHDLGLALLAQRPPNPRSDPERWAEYERARVEILLAAGRYVEVTEASPPAPRDLPADFRSWLATRQAISWLELGDGGKARAVLRPLLWEGDPAATALQREWRRLIAESYRVDGLATDARIAYRRYRQDYPEAAGAIAVPQARALLTLGEPAEALRLLQGSEGQEARALALLAALRAGEKLPADVLREAEVLAAANGIAAADVARYRYVAAEAAGLGRDARGHAERIVKALVAQQKGADEQFALDGDDFWTALLTLGRETGNALRLLIGDDEAWFAAAAETGAKQAKVDWLVRASLLAVVAIEGGSEESRSRAHDRLAAGLADRPDGRPLLRSLYSSAPRHAPRTAPITVRRLRAQEAIAAADFDSAAALLVDISEPPAGVDAFTWRLTRARALILGQRDDQGIAALHEILDTVRSFDSATADRFLQVIFDLQSVQRHEAALTLLAAVEPRLTDERQRREILYWQADSHRALGKYDLAARLYLRSALWAAGGKDQWGQGARFQAAEALAEAGYIADARRQYETLLAEVNAPGLRATLRNKLQALALKR